jgi:hypothetical protein
VLEVGYSKAATDRAKEIVQSWEQFIRDNKDEITALQILYSQPHGKVQFKDIKQLAELIQTPPRSWTPELLWAAYEKLESDRVKGRGTTRLLTDIVSLVRFALHQDNSLVPYGEQVRERFARWFAQQESSAFVAKSMNRLPRLAQRQWDTRLTVGDFGFTGPDRKDGCHSVISGDSCVEMNALDDSPARGLSRLEQFVSPLRL